MNRKLAKCLSTLLKEDKIDIAYRLAALSSRELESVDPEIRELVRKINELPFVQKTLFSCAGYGPSVEEGIHRPSDRFSGYVMITYDENNPQWKLFHKKMKEIADDIRISDDPYGKYGKRYTYYFDCPYLGPYFWEDAEVPTPEELIRKWQEVDKLVNRFLR